ncbi:sensor histidine kinase [Streptomyces sp. Rer75]|uniref:sensor histidine kinase n=1 Tax=unclassified Streptomyces TaxID=2593676 RepID=UPI0015D03AAD|nr:histidine kinase [Streptomyces sp. Rer75]QLH21638.1 two-component sensor histidine kinase [Streptomyces sp. Rer75]
MPLSPRPWPPAWFTAPAYSWASGAALAIVAAAELALVPPHSWVIAIGVMTAAASLMWRASRPAVGLLTAVAVLVSFAAGSDLYVVAAISGLVACHTLGRHRVLPPVVLVAAGAALSLLANLWHIATWGRRSLSLGLFAEAFVLTVAILAAVSTGDAVRAREETRRERAAAQARVIAMERRHAAEAERAAIARELHDVVSHSVSMIAVQAESATYTIPDLTPRAREGFQAIASSARASMGELRHLLGVLRTRPEDERAPTSPQPTLDGLDELLEQHRAVGGAAELRVTGERVPQPASWELSAYRIVQEALTNARRHAPGARTVVHLAYRGGGMTLRVADDGPGPGPDRGAHTGHGLEGMRERAALLGGTLVAGAGPDGGFLVEAELPW